MQTFNSFQDLQSGTPTANMNSNNMSSKTYDTFETTLKGIEGSLYTLLLHYGNGTPETKGEAQLLTDVESARNTVRQARISLRKISTDE